LGKARGAVVQRFSITSSCTEHLSLLDVRGELDIVASPSLVVAGRAALRRGAPRLVVNLSDVTFMDSTGLAALINLQRSVGRAGGRMTVVCPDGPVRRLFATSGTETLLGLQPAWDEAPDGGRLSA
jgi:anti-anti-sigma factor